MKRTWDTAKLDALMIDIHGTVATGIEMERTDQIPDEESTARVIGYWMYRLLGCQDQPLPERVRTVSGPLLSQRSSTSG
jgi:hypothetical protein